MANRIPWYYVPIVWIMIYWMYIQEATSRLVKYMRKKLRKKRPLKE